MADLPVMLRLAGRRCVIVGGGAVARRRAAALVAVGAHVVVVAPRVSPELAALPVTLIERPYRRGDLSGAFLVVVATDDQTLNEAIGLDAKADGILTNRADDPEAGDVSVPAHSRHGPITLAVHTNNISASAAAAIRNELARALDPAWPRVLSIVAPFRPLLQEMIDNPQERQARLVQLTSPEMLALFKEKGEEVLIQRCREITGTARAESPTPMNPAEPKPPGNAEVT